ncbi:MAG: hypothetical protein PGN21_08705, partial [Sphingomonas paucimobilis]
SGGFADGNVFEVAHRDSFNPKPIDGKPLGASSDQIDRSSSPCGHPRGAFGMMPGGCSGLIR